MAPKRQTGLYDFMQIKDEVSNQVFAGLPVISAWEKAVESGKISIKYPQFNNYVKKYIYGNENLPSQKMAKKKTPEKKAGNSQKIFAQTSGIRQYHHDPSADPDELI
ncbi:MAG: TraK family protein [Desulfobacteraceae bacterium]|nr:TraK family protein [Desulfobacteraceae bacterium]